MVTYSERQALWEEGQALRKQMISADYTFAQLFHALVRISWEHPGLVAGALDEAVREVR